MRVWLLLEGMQPVDVAAARVLVTQDDGTPVMVAVERGPDRIRCAHVLDEEFGRVLREMGLDRPVVGRVAAPKVGDFRI